MTKFLHVGVPTTRVQPDETFLDGLKVYITDPAKHPYFYEYLRFVDGTPLPDCITSQPHVAYQVDDLDAALKDCELLFGPMQSDEHTRIAFAMHHNLILELTEVK